MSAADDDVLLRTLERAATPVHFFVRDDDGGWDDERLVALLDAMARAGVPIDLALIPTAVKPALAAELNARRDADPSRLGLHQHGYAHLNHEPEGRKCEFGAARSVVEIQHDLSEGRSRLAGLFGARLDRIFTPPWNRCTPAVPALLAVAGYHALSRDAGAPGQQHLPELPVHVDWSRCWRDARADGTDPMTAVAAAMAHHAGTGGRVGLMLHHAVMDDTEREALVAALQRWSAHPMARFSRMAQLLPESLA